MANPVVVDPPFNPGFSETPPFSWVSGVQWNVYRLVAFFIGQHGDVKFSLQFAGPKHFYTQGDLTKLAREGRRTQIPTLGARIPVPAEAVSINGNYVAYDFPFTTPIPFTIDGDALDTNRPTGRPDYRGYTTLQTFNVGFIFEPSPPSPSSPIPIPVDAEKKYFDFKWKPISAADIPPGPPKPGKPLLVPKGAAIVTDPVDYEGADKGTVYVRIDPDLPPIDTTKLGVAKYDLDGNLLWRVGKYPDLPDTVIHDEGSARVGLVYLRLPGESIGGIQFYNTRGDAGGTIATTVRLPENIVFQDCSRNGRLYGYDEDIDLDPTRWSPIKCYSPTGALLWTAIGEEVEDGYKFSVLTAYGEDYIFVTMVDEDVGLGPTEGENPPSIIGDFYKYQVRDARNGEVVFEGTLEPDITSIQSHGEHSFTRDKPSYGINSGLTRSAYWP